MPDAKARAAGHPSSWPRPGRGPSRAPTAASTVRCRRPRTGAASAARRPTASDRQEGGGAPNSGHRSPGAADRRDRRGSGWGGACGTSRAPRCARTSRESGPCPPRGRSPRTVDRPMDRRPCCAPHRRPCERCAMPRGSRTLPAHRRRHRRPSVRCAPFRAQGMDRRAAGLGCPRRAHRKARAWCLRARPRTSPSIEYSPACRASIGSCRRRRRSP